jgi:mannose-1-phosphate guanylyltransferase
MIVVEPFGRNTAPCIALAAFKLKRIDPDAVMVVLPSDHLIGNEAELCRSISAAERIVADQDCLLTFGIGPTRPETGYGYIELGDTRTVTDSYTLNNIRQFKEKPDHETAKRYVDSGNYLWNSGMFVWRVAGIVSAFEEYLPELCNGLRRIESGLGTDREPDAVREVYESCQSVSIDYAIMEKAQNVVCIRIDVAWNDVGCWSSLDDVWTRDDNGNAADSMVVSLDSGNCVVSSPGKLTALIGIEDLIIVETPDALLVCRKDRAQDVSKLTELLKEKGMRDLL